MIKRKIQFIFKTFFQKLFIIFYGSIKKSNSLESTNCKKISLANIKSDTFPEKKYYLYEVLNGRIYTDTVENVAIIKDNKIIPHISYQQISGELGPLEINRVLKTGTPRIKKKIKGTVLSLVQGASSNNYFHFLFDIITRLKMFEEIYNLSSIDYFYVNNELDWQKKIFSLFGIEKQKLINSDKYRHIEANKIIAIDHPWYHKGRVHDEVQNIPSWLVLWLRKKFLHMSKKFDSNEKIFIDRSESKFNHCQIQNNDEIISFLKAKGFTSYKVGQLDFFEQIYLFNNAKTIIGPHGAAFTNIVFCKPKTNIIEIIPRTHPSKKCKRLSEILDLNFFRIGTAEVKNDEKKYGDIKFTIKDMEELLKKYSNFQ